MHPTDLNGNKEYIVATFPTPYNSEIDRLEGKTKGWDYYTLLWSKEKSDYLNQESFGFKFTDVDRFLDKYLKYLDIIYENILKMINEYKEELSQEKIAIEENPIKQLDILEKEDANRLNGRYKYIINTIRTLIATPISDQYNENKYLLYKKVLINQINTLHNAIQNPNKINSVEHIENIIYSRTKKFDNMSSYYYSKLFEYWNNIDMEELLIEYFKDKIPPFNNRIYNIQELFCLVKAYNYYVYSKKEK